MDQQWTFNWLPHFITHFSYVMHLKNNFSTDHKIIVPLHANQAMPS